MAGRFFIGRIQYSEQLAGIKLPHKYFVLAIVQNGMAEMAERAKDALDFASDEDTRLFAVWRERENCIVVFANMRDEDCMPYVIEQIDSQFGEYGPIQYSKMISDAAHINEAWIRMNNKSEESAETALDRIISAVCEGNSDAALMFIRELLGIIQRQPEMERRGTYLSLLRCIWGMANKYQISLGAEFTRNMMMMEDVNLIINGLTPVIYELTSALGREVDDREAQKLIDCIDKNLGNYELSKEWLAKECGMTENMVGRIFKNVMKRSYTDYVRVCRMKRAKDMLVETEMTVTEIGNALGYINISYFIRAFKEYVGTTPALYRAEQMSEHSEK